MFRAVVEAEAVELGRGFLDRDLGAA